MQQVVVSGVGVIDSFTVVHRASRPELMVPYTVARVRVVEGPVLLTRLIPAEPEPTGWLIGAEVSVAWVDLPDGRALPVFTPEEKR